MKKKFILRIFLTHYLVDLIMPTFHSLATKCGRFSQNILFFQPMGRDSKPGTVSRGPNIRR
jgi:hypothetical protein